MGVAFLQFDKRVVGGGRSRQDAQQWADPRPHPGLGRGIGRQLSTRIGLVDNPANPLALFDWAFGAFRATGQGRLHRGGEQSGLTAGRAIHRLDGDPCLGRNRRDCCSRIPAVKEHAASGVDDPGPGLYRLFATSRRVVATFGSCRFRH